MKRLADDTQALPDLGEAPELRGISEWIDSPPLTLRGQGLRIVGIHTPELDVDRDGRVRFTHFGEGRYDEQERVIKALVQT